MHRGKARCARGIIIHPAYYPYTGTIDEPTPNAGLLGSPLPRVRRDGNLAESFAIYDGVKRTAACRTARMHLLRFIREQDEQRYPPVGPSTMT